jgi:hypothetical protein
MCAEFENTNLSEVDMNNVGNQRRVWDDDVPKPLLLSLRLKEPGSLSGCNLPSEIQAKVDRSEATCVRFVQQAFWISRNMKLPHRLTPPKILSCFGCIEHVIRLRKQLF